MSKFVMDKKSKRKFLSVARSICSISFQELMEDLNKKNTKKHIVENSLQDINIPVLKKAHNDIALFSDWISKFSFKNRNLILGREGIETFGGSYPVWCYEFPELFATRYSNQDLVAFCELDDALKNVIIQSKKIRRICDKQCSAWEHLDLLMSLHAVDEKVNIISSGYLSRSALIK